jgi:uncharacterized damage-inducible protein DinB
MRETERIADQARKMFDGGAWHGPSVLDVLADVDANLATSHPIPGAHTIWELVMHLIACQEVLLRRINGELAGQKPEEFWPAAPHASASAWAETVESLKRHDAALRQEIAAFPDERLDDLLTAGGSSAYNNFHGYAQHNAYHAGQIALLKKASRG